MVPALNVYRSDGQAVVADPRRRQRNYQHRHHHHHHHHLRSRGPPAFDPDNAKVSVITDCKGTWENNISLVLFSYLLHLFICSLFYVNRL